MLPVTAPEWTIRLIGEIDRAINELAETRRGLTRAVGAQNAIKSLDRKFGELHSYVTEAQSNIILQLGANQVDDSPIDKP